MGADYYKILQVDRKSNDDDLKRAFRKLEAKFKEICQAYDVLSDPRKRSVYDQYGEEGLKQRFSPRSAQRFSPRSADDVFSEFFGPSSPFGGQKPRATNSFEFVDVGSPTSVRVSPQNSDDVYSEFFGGGSRASTSSSSGIPLEDMFGNLRMDAQKEAAIEQTLPCSLEELYKGTSKKMKISREVTDAFGRPTRVEEILPIEIKPGWKKGTKITFPKKGNEREGFIPSDLVFIIDEKPHGVFKRDGNDLVMTQRIPLVEALTGYTAQITTLDGRNLTVPINAIITPTYEEVVVGEGMPVPKEPSKKGNLTIKFNVLPSRLTSEQKSGIKRLLTLW